MSELLKCAQCGNKIKQLPGARFTVCSYCGFQTNFEQPKPAPVYNDLSDRSTTTILQHNQSESGTFENFENRPKDRTRHLSRPRGFERSVHWACPPDAFYCRICFTNSANFLRCKESQAWLLESSQSFRSGGHHRNMDNFLYAHLSAGNLRILGTGTVCCMDHRLLGMESEEVVGPFVVTIHRRC